MKAVLFDMDGTIFDTERISYECWCQAAKTLGLPIDISTLIDDMYGLNNHTFAHFFTSRFGADFPYRELIARREECVRNTLLSNGVPKKPGVPAVFDALRARGYKLGLVSSTTTADILRYLSLADLDGTFDLVLGGDAIERGKPEPDCYLLAAERLGVAPADCTVVEDSKNGILSGSRAGMRTVLIPDRQRPDAEMLAHASHRLQSLDELAALLDSLEQNA